MVEDDPFTTICLKNQKANFSHSLEHWCLANPIQTPECSAGHVYWKVLALQCAYFIVVFESLLNCVKNVKVSISNRKSCSPYTYLRIWMVIQRTRFTFSVKDTFNVLLFWASLIDDAVCAQHQILMMLHTCLLHNSFMIIKALILIQTC